MVAIAGLGLCSAVGEVVLVALDKAHSTGLVAIATGALAGLLALLTPRNGGDSHR